MTERTKRDKMINLIKTDTGYDTVNKDGVVQGHIYKLEDGFYYYKMAGAGVWSSNALRLMATVLDDLNADREKEMERGSK